MSRDVYIAIMVAAAKGQGVRITPQEAHDLSTDDAIATRAHNGLDKADWPDHDVDSFVDWSKIDPGRKRVGDNLATGRDDQ